MEGIKPLTYHSLAGQTQLEIDGAIVEETQLCISVNGEELATLMASPCQQEALAVGFLANEGIIRSRHDIRHLHLSRSGSCVDVWLHDTEFQKPRKFIITAGCGGGITFDDLSQQQAPLVSHLKATPEQLASLMRQMHLGASLYQEARGIHTAVLATPHEILLQVEDVGRHNCLDKLRGLALMTDVPTNGRILLSSGRISSEMIAKARKMGIPIVCSRTSPTSLSVSLAEAWQLTIVAYLRQDRMRLYTHPYRILPE